MRYLPIVFAVFSLCAFAQVKVIDDFEKFDKKKWEARENAVISVTNTGDASRKSVLQVNANFAKVTYAWFRITVGAKAIEPQYTALRFFAVTPGDTLLTAVLQIYEGATETKFECPVPLTTDWKEFVLPFSAFKRNGVAPTADELVRVNSIFLVASKKTTDTGSLTVDDVAFVTAK